MPKERMAELLWGDRGDTQARSSLRQALRELRLAINGSKTFIFSDREHIWVASDCQIEDSVNLAAEPKDAFEDLDNITPEFDDWLCAERDRRKTAQIATLQAEAEGLLAKGLAAESSVVLDQIQILDPCNEDALRLGMKASIHRGHPSAAVRRYEVVAAALKEELGVEPSSDSRTLRDSLLPPLNVVDCVSSTQFRAFYETVERELKMGGWECDLATGQLYWTPGTFELFGVPVGSTIRRKDILDQYAAASRELLESARAEAIQQGTGFSIEVDVFTSAGIKKRLRINAAVETRDGYPVRIFGTKQLVS
jgi:PAS domain-containing protein